MIAFRHDVADAWEREVRRENQLMVSRQLR